MEPAMESRLQSSGRLRKRYQPAVYLDPSFFSGYVERAIARLGATAGTVPAPAAGEPEAAFDQLVERIRDERLGLTPVLGSLTLLDWMRELGPLYGAPEGDATTVSREESDFAGLRFQSWLNRRLGSALDGLLQVDLRGFELRLDTVREDAAAAVLLESGEHGGAPAGGSAAGATLHALVARHLGCGWLATLRPEVARVGALLGASGGPRTLLGPRAVLEAASRHRREPIAAPPETS